mgnify:FL=1
MVAQVAKGCGATVIMAGLTNDAERFKIAKECGIDVTVDQMTQDLKSIVMEMTNNEGADKCLNVQALLLQQIQPLIFAEEKELWYRWEFLKIKS